MTSQAEVEVARIRDLLAGAGLEVEPEPYSDRDAEILELIVAGGYDERAVPTATRSGWRRPAVRVAAAAAAVVAVAVGGVLWEGDRAPAAADRVPLLTFSEADVRSVVEHTAPPARDVLLRIADAAAAQPAVAGEGWQEVSSYAWWLATDDERAVISPTSFTSWVGPDGAVVTRQLQGPALGLDGQVIDGSYGPGGPAGGDTLPAGSYPLLVPSLPRDPAATKEALAARWQPAGTTDETQVAGMLVSDVWMLFTNEIVPGDLAAALWRMLADEPAVVSLGATTDRIGRPVEAIAVSLGDGPVLQGADILLVDPATGQVLGWEHVLTRFPDLGIDAATVTAFQAVLSSRWVDSPPRM